MTYQCEIHGPTGKDWCEHCKKVLECDSKNQTTARFKDLKYDCDDGEKTTTIWVKHCETCGKITGVI